MAKDRGAEAIIAAGIDEIARVGYPAASIRAIAKRADMSSSSLYYHFPSKQDLLFHIMDSGIENLLEESAKAMAAAGDDPEARLRALVGIHVLLHAKRTRSAMVSSTEVRHLKPAQRRALTEKLRAQQRNFDHTVDAGVRAGAFDVEHPKDAARALASMCTAVASWYKPRGGLSPTEVSVRYQERAAALMQVRR